VVDQTGTLSASDIASLTQKLQDLERRKGSQVAVLIVPTTQPETIEQFSIRVADTWRIGRRRIDDGALLVVAKNDRHLRIEVGYGLEGSLTDLTTKRIIDEAITPKFRAGDFAGGISAGVDRMVRLIDGEELPAPEPSHWQNTGFEQSFDLFDPFVLIFGLMLAGVLRSALGRMVGSAATGGLAGFLVWLFVGSLAAAALIGVAVFVFALMFGGLSPFIGTVRSAGPAAVTREAVAASAAAGFPAAAAVSGVAAPRDAGRIEQPWASSASVSIWSCTIGRRGASSTGPCWRGSSRPLRRARRRIRGRCVSRSRVRSTARRCYATRRKPGLGQRLIDASLIGAERAAAL